MTEPFISGVNLISSAEVGTTSEESALPVKNLTDELYKLWRSTGTMANLYCTWPTTEYSNVFALGRHNFSQTATWDVGLYGDSKFSLPLSGDVIGNYDVSTTSGSFEVPGNGSVVFNSFVGTVSPKTSEITNYDAGKTYGAILAGTNNLNTHFTSPPVEEGGDFFVPTSGNSLTFTSSVTSIVTKWDIRERVAGTTAAEKITGHLNIWGGLPWGSFPFFGKLNTKLLKTLPATSYIVISAPQLVQVAYASITDTDNEDGYLEAGFIHSGYAWFPFERIQFPFEMGIIDPVQVERLPSGFYVPANTGSPYRQMRLNIKGTEAEMVTNLRYIDERIAGGNPILISPYHGHKDNAYRHYTTIYGYLRNARPGRIPNYSGMHRTLVVDEVARL